MTRKGGTLVLMGVFLLIGLVGVQHARQPRQGASDSESRSIPTAYQPAPGQPPARAADEVEMPLLEAVRDLLDDVDAETDEDLDDLRKMLDEIEKPWRDAKAEMHRGIHEANRKFRSAH